MSSRLCGDGLGVEWTMVEDVNDERFPRLVVQVIALPVRFCVVYSCKSAKKTKAFNGLP